MRGWKTRAESTSPLAHQPSQRQRARSADAQLAVGAFGGHPPTRGAVQEASLEQVGLHDIFDRVGLLADGRRQRGQTHRSPAEPLHDGPQDRVIEPV